MASDKQIAANRANAQKSTGPKTDAGKSASSKNAVRHGALSSIAVAEHEDGALFTTMLNTLMNEHDPQTVIEHQLVERLAVLFWRESRLAKAEAFETRANLSNLEFEQEMEKKAKGSYVLNRLPKHYRTVANILPVETQLLVGRYQTMLSNQITQTLKQLREERALREKIIDVNAGGEHS